MGKYTYGVMISEMKCDHCEKSFTFTCPRERYLYRRSYKGKLVYFCCEQCKTNFEKDKNIKKYRRL